MLLLQPAMIDWGPCFSFVFLVEQLAAEDRGSRPRGVEIARAVTICRQQLWPPVEKIGAPLLEDELVESGIVAVAAIADIPLSMRLLYLPR